MPDGTVLSQIKVNMIDVKTIEAMYSSLWRGYKEYKFSELRAALKQYEVPDLENLKLNLKSDREALLKIAEKFLMDALNINSSPQVENNEYPDIPLTYGWQFEGIDDSEDCFLYPTTPLTCDVLSGQFCEVSTKQNRSKSTMPKGFKKIKSIQVESAFIPLPHIGEVVAYLRKGSCQWIDLDDLTEILEIAFSPELEGIKVYQVRPGNGIYKNKIRRAIQVEMLVKTLERAASLGNKNARKLYHEILGAGVATRGDKAIIHYDGRVEGKRKRIGELNVVTEMSSLLVDDWLIFDNFPKYNVDADDGDYTDLSLVVNLVVASFSNRKQSKINRREAVIFLRYLYPSLDEDNSIQALNQDDDFYQFFWQDCLSETRKHSLINPSKLPLFIQQCTEVASIIDAKTSKDPNIKLINGWVHPLSDVQETGKEVLCNTWQFASMCLGAATGRAPAANPENAIETLIELGVISPGSIALHQAKIDDSIYLQLLGATKEAMDLRIERTANNQ